MSSSDKTVTEGDGGGGGGGGLRKSKKKQKKKDDAWRPEGPRDPFVMLNTLPEKKQQEIQRALHLFTLGPTLPRTLQQARRHSYKFWDTQPVPRLDEEITTNGPILDGDIMVRQQPLSLTAGFCWDSLNLSNTSEMKELCTLLNDNYTEDDDNTIRLSFTPEYLQWVLCPPNWRPQWHCGLRVDANKKLVGFIAAVPVDVRVCETQRRMVQVRPLCVHKKLRLKRMAPVLIRELTRRVNQQQQGLRQAVFATAAMLPTPLSTCRYWQRPLNPRKLMELNFPGLRQHSNLQRALKFNRLPEANRTKGLRPMTREDVAGTHSLLLAHSSSGQFQLGLVWSRPEVEHWLLPRENVVYTYVVEADDGTLTSVVSFHCVSSRVLNHPLHSDLRAAQLLHLVSTPVDMVQLMEDTLVLAKSKGFDLFSALDVTDNREFLETLKFSVSDRGLHFYLYNWRCPTISPDKVCLMLPH